MDDGVLHTVLIKKVGRVRFATMFGTYSDGEYQKLPKHLVRVVTAKSVRIQADEEFTTCVDGECFRSKDVTMRLSDKKLNFFGPKGSDPNKTAR